MEIIATLDKEDLGHIYDILADIAYPEEIPYDRDMCISAWDILPENIKGIAYQWGVSDSVFRDDAWVFLDKYIKAMPI